MALFDSLLELQWADIGVPFESLDTSGSHDIAEHKRVDRQGARLEGTGRNPYEFEVRIPFINGLARGPQETWDHLFPATFLAFLSALEDRETKPMQHPLFGKINCKAATWKIALTADQRGGVVVDVRFRETNDDAAENLADTGALGLVNSAASSLDDQMNQMTDPPDLGLDDAGFDSLEDFASEVSSVGDQVDQLQNKVVGKIDSVVASIDKMTDAIDTTLDVVIQAPGTTVTTLMNLGNASSRVVESSMRLNFALVGLKSQLQTKDKTIAFFTTKTYSTIAGIARELSASVSDLVSLNPVLAAALVVPPETVVRYYSTTSGATSSPFG